MRRARFLRLAPLALVLALVACDAPPGDGTADGGTAVSCTSTLDCPGSLVCVDGLCQIEGCEAGTEGCTCARGDRCGRGADSEPLVCIESVCSSMTCPAGDRGCTCIDGSRCDDAADECSGGYCIPSDCLPGESGCSCIAGTCDVALHCLGGSICVDDDGYESGPCLANGRCYAGARCDATLELCVHCEAGSEGCSCTASSTCNDGLACAANLCVPASSLPPSDPVCYTPCREDLTTTDGTRACDSDGLMEGCIGDLECTSGSCVLPGDDPPTCTTDLDCPFFQTCLLGGCYSNCEANVDCPSGLGCHQRVCRVPCESSAGADPCASGTFCDARDGQNGYCVQLSAEPSSGGSTTATGEGGGFALDHPALAFSNVDVEGAVTLIVSDDDHASHPFTVRRISHTVTRRDGTIETVEAERDASTGALVACDAAAGECPLSWLDIATTGVAASRDAEITFAGRGSCADDDSCPEITVGNAGGVDATRWQGEIEITGNGGRSTLTLTYVERADGQWVGTMHYFATFPTGGLATWRARADRGDVTGVQNGLIARWAAFRRGNLSGGWHEMRAVLTSTETESWGFDSVESRCASASGACYPYTNSTGIRTYVTNLAATPIPRGMTELPFLMSLRQPGTTATQLTGRIDSATALHYPGDPAVTVQLAADPSATTSCSSSVTTDCVVFLSSLSSVSVVGGRYPSTDGTCASGYTAIDEPWLVPGFTAGTTEDETGRLYRTWCVDSQLPYGTASATAIDANRSLAGANPVPDGVPRRRTIAMLDGALINQTDLFFLFEETFDTFVQDGSSSATASYGYVLLRRQPVEIDDADEDGDGVADIYQGNTAPTITRTAPTRAGATCDPDLVRDITGSASGDPRTLSSASLSSLVDTLLSGTQPAMGTTIPTAQIHYYCEETGLFDGGADDDGTASAVSIPCPRGSRVVFFSVPTSVTQAHIASQRCQETVSCDAEVCTADGLCDTECTGGTCQATLNLWRSSGIVEVYEPFYQCTAASTVYCDDDRLDLRTGKTFYRPLASTARSFVPLQAAIESAFRYRTRFNTGTGSRPGFAPQICVENSDSIPYCYDPPTIEEITQRVDCLVDVYSDDTMIATVGSASAARRTALETFLKGDFSEFAVTGGTARDGFERLYSELLVMMGDEALTQAYASRFDLAGAGGASFEGSLLEANGIDLSGVAGFEMVSLYRAVQTYQMALDRVYALGPDLTEALTRNASVDSNLVFVSAETVVLYLERLIRASTQRARAYSEIARRYQMLNRADLSRAVLERAYASAYMESIVLTRLMYAIEARSTRADAPQIELTITQALRRYRMALLDMRDLYGTITDDLNFFGLDPNFIPFPPLDESARGRNAFEVMIEIAQSRSQLARQREDQALSSNRSFQTDTAQFQAELVRLRSTYESQLSELCGTFTAETDGRVYPATRRYASLSRYPEQLGDPCGRLGNGQIHNAMVAFQQGLLSQEVLQTRLRNLIEEINIEARRVERQCDLVEGTAQFQYEQGGRVRDLQTDIAETRLDADLWRQRISTASDALQASICVAADITTTTSCLNEAIDGTIRYGAALGTMYVTETSEREIIDRQEDLANIEAETARWVTTRQCDAAEIDSDASTARQLLQLRELDIEMRRAARDSQLQLAEIGRLYNEAQRRQVEQEEMQDLIISVESARNDPNVRVYRNDAVLNADISFTDAMRAAYRATRVFEYYTSQTYAGREQLYLIRMVGAGEYNLENYLLDLQNAFLEFEEQFGAADTRVMVLSLRDDVMQIPRLDDSGGALSETERITLMRERLADVDLLDENGYLTISFGTDLGALSPLTRNHKVDYVEAEYVGSRTGDTVGRLYLRPTGTGVIHALDDSTDYYLFPERTAVVNTFFNGNRVFSPDVYRAERLRDRPLVNTTWEVVLNQRDERVNQDIDLQSLSDIRLYVYYSDFTVL